MTRAERGPAWLALAMASLLAAGCGRELDVFPEPGGGPESAQIIRVADRGCILVSYASFPFRPGAPPDGMRDAVTRAAQTAPCSAAAFFWSKRETSEAWIGEQLNIRRRNGLVPRLILIGHGLGGAEAAEATRELLARAPDAQIVLLVTVDAVRAGRMTSAAGVTGAMVNRIPGVSTSLAAYDAAPSPDGLRFMAHVNYYQDQSQLYHGSAMPGAENHRLEDWTGLLNHGNADDFALPEVYANIRAAMERWSQ